MIYTVGPAEGLDSQFYAPDGVPWCQFVAGSLVCVNGESCKNPRHSKWRPVVDTKPL